MDRVFPGQPQSFGINADQWMTAAQDEGGWQDGGTRGGTFHGDMDSCRKGQ